MEPIGVAVIGASGYAQVHHRAVAHGEHLGLCRLEAVAMLRPYREELGEPQKAASFAERGVRVYDSYEDMLDSESERVGLVTVPTGIALHAPMSVAALSRGYDVYCEKPMAGTLEAARAMLVAEESSGRTLCMGYQHLSRPTIQTIKARRVTQAFGPMRRARCWVIWPRPRAYYRRNDWAGRLRVGDTLIYDSPLQNATAHYLQNMLYIAGTEENTSAWPKTVYAEQYRANDIESADTQFVRLTTADEITIEMWVTHAGPRNVHPSMEIEFDDARVQWFMNGDTVVYRGDSEIERIRDPDTPETLRIVEDILHSLAEGRKPRSLGMNSIQHVATVNAAFEAAEIVPIPEGHLHGRIGDASVALSDPSDELIVVIDDIEAIMGSLYKDGKSFAEAGLRWARAGGTVDVKTIH